MVTIYISWQENTTLHLFLTKQRYCVAINQITIFRKKDHLVFLYSQVKLQILKTTSFSITHTSNFKFETQI